jgi:hypothetical protein
MPAFDAADLQLIVGVVPTELVEIRNAAGPEGPALQLERGRL